ncbi:MAG: hypothetical protein Q8N29_01820, partial [Methylobacter sp.]|nr:hypothetical protein [Methylobacter sp.]
SPALPFGLLAEMLPQHEQAWVLYASLTSMNTPCVAIDLYSSCVFSIDQPASKTDFAIALESHAVQHICMFIPVLTFSVLVCVFIGLQWYSAFYG